MIERTLDVSFDEIIIGCNLSALSYAYNRNIPLIFLRHLRPNKYLEKFDIGDINRYNNLLFHLSFNSKTPFCNLINSIRLEDGLVKAFTKSNITLNISVKKTLIADDYNILGLPAFSHKSSNINLVIDYFDIGKYKKYELINYSNDTEILKTINYPVNDNKNYNCVTTSLIKDDNLNKFEYSQSFVRLNLLKLINSSYAVSYKREILPLGYNIYTNIPPNIVFLHQEECTKDIIFSEKKKFYG